MPSEKSKMLRGDLYDPSDPELVSERHAARLLIKAFNAAPEEDQEARAAILKGLIPHSGEGLWIEPPFYCDYGGNISTGDKVYFNFNCVVLDVAPVRIGSRVMCGPSVQIYTATHPMDHRERSSGLELGKAIEIGDDVWIGGGAILCPGVRIGARTVIGAGSVVTKDLPPDVFAAGNPCRVIRSLRDPGPHRAGPGWPGSIHEIHG